MEIEFLRCKARHIAIRHETLTFRSKVVLTEMWQGSSVEAEGNTFSVDVLLADASHNLRDIHITSFRPGTHHLPKSIPADQPFVGQRSGFFEGGSECRINFMLKAFFHTFSWQALKLTSLCLLRDSDNFPFEFCESALDDIYNTWGCDDVRHTDSETVGDQPIIHHILRMRHPVFARLRAAIFPNDVDEASGCSSNRWLLECAAHQFAVFNEDIVVFRASPGFAVWRSDEIDFRNDQ